MSELCPDCGFPTLEADKDGPAKMFCGKCGYEDYDKPSRADVCVKALDGVEDPEAFMREVREFFSGERPDHTLLDSILEHLKGGAQ